MKIKRSSFKAVVFALSIAIFLNGCAGVQFFEQFMKGPTWRTEGSTRGAYKIGNPYKVLGAWYTPKEDFNLVETGIASWYGPGFHADSTANGEVYNQNALTAAHKTLQMPSFVKVTNLENGRSVVVRINDRGPFKRGRIIDLSKRAAELLDMTGQGTARVRIQVMEKESRILAAAAKRGDSTINMDYDEVRSQVKEKEHESNEPPRVALNNKREIAVNPVDEISVNNNVPESLMTPTITVEALKEDNNPINRVKYRENVAAIVPNSRIRDKPKLRKPVAYVPEKSRTYTPKGLVYQEPVVKTGIFVQAGTFSIAENAHELAKDLKKIGPVKVDMITSSKGKEFYRVRLGPFTSVAEADNVLDKVVKLGSKTAWLIR